MAKVIFGANLKMMNPVPEGSTSFSELEKLLIEYQRNDVRSFKDEREVILFAPYTHLQFACDKIGYIRLNISLGSQGVSEHVFGAHTSGISPVWLKELGVKYVLVGHSEVRAHYEELVRKGSRLGNDVNPPNIEFQFNNEIRNALKHGLNVVYCVGETEDEKELKKTDYIIGRQVHGGLNNLNPQDLGNKLTIAYEPRWAIGGNKLIPTDKEIKQAHQTIRECILEICQNYSKDIPILYGGSMNETNAERIMSIPGVDGGLVGSACLDAEKFGEIVNYKSA